MSYEAVSNGVYMLYVSTNGGLSFTGLRVSQDFDELLLHPTRPQRFLGLSSSTVCI